VRFDASVVERSVSGRPRRQIAITSAGPGAVLEETHWQRAILYAFKLRQELLKQR
jgi:hypothetical protein